VLADITKRVDDELTRIFKTNSSVLNFVLKHERKQVLIRNLAAEIMRVEGLSMSFDAAKYQRVIKDFAKQFATSALQHAEEKALSDAERARRIWEADRIKRAEEHIDSLEKETLHANREEDWAKAEIQKRILQKTD
jgi:hypothetical protein